MSEAGAQRGTGWVGGSGKQRMYVGSDAEPNQIGEDWWVYLCPRAKSSNFSSTLWNLH